MEFVFGKFAKEAGEMYMQLINYDGVKRKAFKGSEEFLQRLKDADIPFAIVTNSWLNAVENGIKTFGWQDLLKKVPIITCENVEKKVKPDPHHFKCALKQLGFNVDNPDQREIIVIGDGIGSDMVGALNLSKQGFNIRSIWINHGENIKCKLSAYNNFEDVAAEVILKNRIGLKRRVCSPAINMTNGV